MEWHLHTKYFKNGYGWLFPHRETLSIGAYVDQKVMSAKRLKEGLVEWASTKHIDLTNESCSAEFINFDFKGWEFKNIFLVGDAAGLASALTGEGIFSAIVSGETVANKILDPHADCTPLNTMIKRQRRFRKMVELTGRSKVHQSLLAEAGLLLLRLKILNFKHLEMAG